jgi:hypothetical protein
MAGWSGYGKELRVENVWSSYTASGDVLRMHV